MTKIKTELEQKIYLLDSLKSVKQAVNEAGGEITDDTPYSQYGEKVSEVAGGSSSEFEFMKMMATGTMTSANSFDIEFERELGDLSTETYVASFSFEPIDEENDLWSLVGGTLTKDGEEIGEAEIYVQVSEYNSAVSTFQKLPTVLERSGEEGAYGYDFSIGDYDCSFTCEIDENEDEDLTIIGSAGVGENMVGTIDLYFKIPPQEPGE